jgi:protein gp37
MSQDIWLDEQKTTPLSNVWLGVTVESSNNVDRIAELQEANFAHRFVSFEPLLSHIPIGSYLSKAAYRKPIEWAIVGGETGPGDRVMNPIWAIYIRDKCIENNIPFFFKKWGGKVSLGNQRILDGREWNEFPKEMKPFDSTQEY